MRFLRPCVPLVLTLLAAAGCARDVIPNTDVEDTAENREVLEFVELYRNALIARDVGAILRLVDPSYFDDNGTPVPRDDIDYDRLRDHLGSWQQHLADVRYEIKYRRVTYTESNRVLVDYTYSGRFKINDPQGERWARRLADNRIVLTRVDGEYRIVSGL
jgi:hypothetical protein